MNASGAVLLVLLAFTAPDDELSAALAKLKAVAPEGKGNEEAAKAWKAVVARGPDALIPTLEAFEGADPRASNWLRSAAEAILETALAKKQPVDLKKLDGFLLDVTAPAAARFLAFEWLPRLTPDIDEDLAIRFVNDPARELRRAGIGRLLRETEKILKAGRKSDAIESYRRLLPSARDRDQVDLIVKQLKTLGVDTDVQALYGVIPKWVLITTFDNAGMKGFDVAYPPEKAVDLNAKLEGKGAGPVRFVTHTTSEPRGKVDLNAALGKEMGAVAYAFTLVESPEERPVEIRVGTNNAAKIFLNGKLLFFHHEYHHGMVMDQYVGRGTLKKGANELLLKICQNEQKDDWAQTWGFQARLSDALGGAVPFKVVLPETKQ